MKFCKVVFGRFVTLCALAGSARIVHSATMWTAALTAAGTQEHEDTASSRCPETGDQGAADEQPS
jgi:hypothetical protein